MIAVAPESASISAAISPVWAPEAFGWQSWAPTATFLPRAFSAKAAIRVAGGQTSRSALPATSAAPLSMASNSAVEAFRPFIFQLPAIRGRMASVMSNSSKIRFVHALAEVPWQFQRPGAFNRSFAAPRDLRLRGESRHFMMVDQFGDALL